MMNKRPIEPSNALGICFQAFVQTFSEDSGKVQDENVWDQTVDHMIQWRRFASRLYQNIPGTFRESSVNQSPDLALQKAEQTFQYCRALQECARQKTLARGTVRQLICEKTLHWFQTYCETVPPL